MSDIFIAYSRADRGIAEGLRQEIAKLGWSVWWDEDLEPGKSLAQEILEQIKRARVVIALWTETAVNSQWVFAETILARGHNRRFLPIVWGTEIQPPDIFEQLAPIVVRPERGAVDWGVQLESLKRALETMLGPYRKLQNAESLRVLSWNLAGAKHLARGPDKTNTAREILTEQLALILEEYKPHIVALQEYVRFVKGSSAREDTVGLIDQSRISNYRFAEEPLIDNKKPSHPEKWQRFEGWGDASFLSQGMAMLWRSDMCAGNIWDFKTTTSERLPVEVVRMETGLYTGNRDTEPRAAIVGHFVFGPNEEPRDVLVVNVHLSTLKHEREGKPLYDELGRKARMNQIDVLLNGLVSRYNSWWDKYEGKGQRKPPIWILAGDFNCTPNSPEISRLIQSQFINLNPDPKWGSRGDDRELNVDYIFAGPKYRALRHRAVEEQTQHNPAPIKTISSAGCEAKLDTSDHYPVFAELPLK